MVDDKSNFHKNGKLKISYGKQSIRMSQEEKEWLKRYPVLSNKDFFSPRDNRHLKTGVNDYRVNESFYEFFKKYNIICEENEIYEDN